ncbi:MAG: hypothetical protein Q9207_004245 [Kuettlingeria erythrocarpa]
MDSWAPQNRVRSRLWTKFKVKKFNLEAAFNGEHDNQPVLKSDATEKFLVAVGGDASDKTQGPEDHSTQQQTYLRYLEQKIMALPMRHVDEIMGTSGGPLKSRIDRMYTLLTTIANCIAQENHFSIEKAMDDCVKTGVLSSDAKNNPILRDKASVVIFTCIAWISMLYPPVGLTDTLQTSLAIDATQCVCMLDSQSTTNAKMPICEVIQDFGPLLGNCENIQWCYKVAHCWARQALPPFALLE